MILFHGQYLLGILNPIDDYQLLPVKVPAGGITDPGKPVLPGDDPGLFSGNYEIIVYENGGVR